MSELSTRMTLTERELEALHIALAQYLAAFEGSFDDAYFVAEQLDERVQMTQRRIDRARAAS